MFQEDIYPPCEAPTAALSADEWAAGTDKDPRKLTFSQEGLNEVRAVNEREGASREGREEAGHYARRFSERTKRVKKCYFRIFVYISHYTFDKADLISHF